MRKNLEIKARYPDAEKAVKIAGELTLSGGETDLQEDYYFNTRKGLLKLRVSKLSGAYLIPYIRPRKKGERLSRFLTIPVEAPESSIELLDEILGIDIIVKKERKIYFYENVRVHIDRVEKLGAFLEFEAVFDTDNADEESERQKLEYLMREFAIERDNLIADSYYHLLNRVKDKSEKS